MSETIEQIEMLKKAHSRLYNQYNQLSKDLDIMKNKEKELFEYFFNHIHNLQETINELKSIQQPKVVQSFLVDNIYKEQISEIISQEEKDWKNQNFINYEIKLKGREEIYTVFLSLKYRLLPGFNIKFLYDGSGKLKNVRII